MGIVKGDNSLFFSTGLDNSGLKQGKFEAVNIIKGLGSKLSKINPFIALSVAAVAAFGIIANEGYKMVKSFESAMAEVRTIANVSDKDFDKLEKSVFGLYKQLGTEPPDKLAKGLYEIIGAGFEAGDALGILEIASKAATAGVTETAVASDGLTTILNAFKLESKDAQAVADIMFATVDRGKISFEELSSQIAVVAPIAAASNISFEEVGAAVATLTKQGTPASVAMTQIRSAIISTNEVLGDGAFKTLSLQEGFQKMYESADGSQNKLKELAGRIEAVNGIIGIAGPNLKGATGDLDAMAKSAGSVDRSFKTITSTTANQWKIFGNKIKATTKGIGDAVLIMSGGLVSSLNKGLDALQGVTSESIKQASEFKLLRNELNSANTSFDRKVEILKEIKQIYPEYLTNLDTDKINNENLNDVLQKVKKSLKDINQEHKNRIELSAYNDDVISARDELKAQEGTLDRAKKRFSEITKKANEEATKKGVELELSFAAGDDIDSIVNEIVSKVPSFTMYDLDELRGAGQFIKNQENSVESARKELEKVNFNLDEENRKIYDNEKGYEKIVNQIKNINSLNNLEQFKGFNFPKIKEAVEERKKVIIELNSIKEITEDQYKANKNIFKESLDSENKQIAEAAKKRKAFFDFKRPTGGDGEDDRTEIERFNDLLNERKKQYKSYNNYVNQLGKEAADKEFDTLLTQGANYTEYLRSQLIKFQDNQDKKIAISNAASSGGVGLKPREKVTALEVPTFGIKQIKVDPNFTLSIDYLNKELVQLQEKLNSSTNDLERNRLAILVQFKQEEIEIKKGATSIIQKVEENNYDFLGLLSLKKISQKRKESEKLLQIAKDKAAKEAALSKKGTATIKTQKEIKQLEDNLIGVAESFGEALAGVIEDVSSGLSGTADLFSKFGDDETASLLDQFAGVASGIGKIASGDIIGGSIEVLKSALTVEVVSDTAKFEASIKELEKVIDKLDYAISKSVGADKISNRKATIEKLKEIEKQAELATKAELKARKEVKFLGARLGDKGSGSGTDPAKLEELAKKIEDAKRKAIELKEQLNELYTGTTETTIVDSIISGLKEGKRSVADFADNFKDLMQDAMLQAFQTKYLEKQIQSFYDAFSKAGADSNFTADEIDSLRSLYNRMIQGAQGDLDAINQILEDSGIGGLGSKDNQQQGLAGAISTITEDTANILAGTINSIRIDVQEGLDVARNSLAHLSQIAQNTSYNKHLEDMALKLKNIDDKL